MRLFRLLLLLLLLGASAYCAYRCSRFWARWENDTRQYSEESGEHARMLDQLAELTPQTSMAYVSAWQAEEAGELAAIQNADHLQLEKNESRCVLSLCHWIRLNDAGKRQGGMADLKDAMKAELVFLRGRIERSRLRAWWGSGLFAVLCGLTVWQAAAAIMAARRGSWSLEHARQRFDNTENAAQYAAIRSADSAARDSRFEFESGAIRQSLALLPGVKTVLDAPCGAGRFAGLFRDAGVVYHGADLSVSMLREARRADGASALARCCILSLPFAGKAFDFSVMIRLLHHVPQREVRVAMFRELARVSRHGVLISYFDAASASHAIYMAKHAFRGSIMKRGALLPGQLEAELREAGLAPMRWFQHRRFLTRNAFVLAVPVSAEKTRS